MKNLQAMRSVLAAALLCLSTLSQAAIQLIPVVSSGLSSPIFVGHAGDGTHRLFIVEQGGVIRVLQPTLSVPTTFLDIHTTVLAGGERGLLGLAFHPQYATNGRFFVYYTRPGDGAIVIAEYGVSGDPNVANTAETVLLTIPHPTNANHNGGMLAFGSDGYLYAGVGDGGSGDDPPNNAQNINVLLGKILRIDIDHPDPIALTPYSSPSDNPYVGMPGRDEIFSIGWRNPWRFSFDRSTHQQWVGDVGQGAREEVDTPIVKGGNYGWRVYEGTSCTNNDPTLCNPANYIFPIFEYTHSGGRCSITGGYVYRGTQGTLPPGTYVYGDYCTGEIFSWNGVSQSLLLDTAFNISSFGEDERGELYVVNLGGSVSRIARSPPCTYSLSPNDLSNRAATGGAANITVTTQVDCPVAATSYQPWVTVDSITTNGGTTTVALQIGPNVGGPTRATSIVVAGRLFLITQLGS
jgi:glucose/arabinose dehydrogenase